nr:hypothetical protein [Tanacetum cinerariifolium]
VDHHDPILQGLTPYGKLNTVRKTEFEGSNDDEVIAISKVAFEKKV